MLSSQKMDAVWVLYLESHQQTNGFQRVKSFVDIVSQTNIFKCLHFFFIRVTKIFKNVKQVLESSIYAAKDLCWGASTNQRGLLRQNFGNLLTKPDYFVFFEGKECKVLQLP